MSVKKEAAYHEASHAVLAYKSKYHSLVHGINLHDYGAGEIYVLLSKSKCIANGKPANESAAKDKEVARDLAVVLCGGLVGEEIAAAKHTSLLPNASCAEPDHQLAKQVLHDANTSKKLTSHAETARKVLQENWDLTEKVAEFLFEHIEVSCHQILIGQAR